MKISLFTILFYTGAHCLYMYLQIHLQEFAILGVIVPSLWLMYDQNVTFWAKVIGAPVLVMLHLYGSYQGLFLLQLMAYLAMSFLPFSRIEPIPIPSRKLNTRMIVVDDDITNYISPPLSPMSPLSPSRRNQSVGFILPSFDEYDTPAVVLDSPRILRSEERLKRDRKSLQLAVEEARNEEMKRALEKSSFLLKRK